MQATPDRSWVIGKHGLLSLRALVRNGRTEIDPIKRRVPYQWQGVHYQDHDDEPFLLLHNSAGGFVEGDAAELYLECEPNTRALLTTTAATKFYKCEEGGESTDSVEFSVGDNALLEYLPDEVIPFSQSRVARRTRIRLATSSRLFFSDLIGAGRINYGDGEAFAFTSIRSDLELEIDGTCVLRDRLIALGVEEVSALERLWAGHRFLGTMLAYAPDLPADLDEALAEGLRDGAALASSRRGQLVCIRLLASEAWQAHEAVQHAWSIVRPALAGKAARPIAK